MKKQNHIAFGKWFFFYLKRRHLEAPRVGPVDLVQVGRAIAVEGATGVAEDGLCREKNQRHICQKIPYIKNQGKKNK